MRRFPVAPDEKEDGWEDVDREILQRRARQLARPRQSGGERERTVALLAFTMLGSPYAVELERVDAVSRIGEIHHIPLTPPHIGGIIRRRGTTMALVNLRRFFHPEAEGIADADFAIVVRAGGKLFALQIEEIEGVFQLPESKIEPAPENFDRAQVPYLLGVIRDGAVVLSLERLVRDERFSAVGAG